MNVIQKLCGVGLLVAATLNANGQIEFLSHDKKLDLYTPEVDEIKVKFTIPEGISKYQEIVFAVENHLNITRYNPAFSKAVYYPTSQFSTGQTHEMWIMKPGKEDGEFCSSSSAGTYCYNPIYRTNSIERDFKEGKLSVKIMGRNIDRYEFNDHGKRVPVYKYTDLAEDQLKLNYGDFVTGTGTENGSLTTQKYTSPEGLVSNINVDNKYEIIDQTFNVDKNSEGMDNSVLFRIRSHNNSKYEGNPYNVDVVKESIPNQLMRSIDSRSKKHIEGIAAAYYWYSDDKLVYEPFLIQPQDKDDSEEKEEKKKNSFFDRVKNMTSGNSKKDDVSEEAIVKQYETEKSKLEWKPGKVGGIDCEILELQMYTMDQIDIDQETKNKTVKPDQVGKTKPVLFFVGESNGKIIAGSLHKHGHKPLNDAEKKFWDFMLTGGTQIQ